MKTPNPDLKGRSYLWAFGVYLLLFSAAAVWGGAVGLSKNAALVLLALSGFIPLAVQATSGYAIDGAWVAKYSRAERPVRYWVSIALSAVFAAFFVCVAYNLSQPSA